jgi:hypothetical protein
MSNAPNLTRSMLVLLLCFTSVLAALVPNSVKAHAVTDRSVIVLSPDPPQQNGYSISPSTGVQGSVQDITVTSAQCLGPAPAASLAGVTVFAPQGSGITVANVNVPAAGAGMVCNSIVKFTIAASAPLGPVKISLLPTGGGPALASLDFTISGVPAGPIPPQLNNQGQVDVMWYVVSSAIVNDNFGGRIAKQYYAIDVVIGNDSGYDLQLASIGFTVPSLTLGNLKYKIPSTGYRVVRGSLQSREQLAPRNFIINAVKIAGPILTGFTPFFHNTNHKANFTEAINILSNPFEKGLNAIFPDLIPEELNRLADQAFRDDISTKTVIPNNVQARILTFVPKKVLFPQTKKSSGCPTAQKDNLKRNVAAAATLTAPMVPGCLDKDNLQDVMLMLGEIVLIGDQVSHVNRIRVVSTPLGPAPTDFSVSGRVIDGCNSGVGGVNITISAGAGFVSRQVTTLRDGTYTFANVPAGRTYTVTPSFTSLPAVTFQPASNGLQTFSLNGDQTNVDFSTTNVAVISGNVINGPLAAVAPLAPVQGVTITLAPGGPTIPAGPITTDAQGNFYVVVPGPFPAGGVNVTATRVAPAATINQTSTCANPRVNLQLP